MNIPVIISTILCPLPLPCCPCSSSTSRGLQPTSLSILNPSHRPFSNMSSFFSIFLLLSALSTNAFAQNSTTLPFAACLLPCDTAALAAVNCTSSDTLCHCHNAPATFAILVPCVLSNSTCGSAGEADLISISSISSLGH